MKPEDIYDAIGEVNDADIANAKKPITKQSKLRPWLKWGGIAASFVFVAGIGTLIAIIFRGGSAGGGASEGLTYMSYAGPVFPLTLKDEAEITADRDINLDFADYVIGEYGNTVTVTDAYTLHNPTNEDITVTALYPYAKSGTSNLTLNANGDEITPEIYYGGYNPKRTEGFEDYEAIIKGGGYPEAIYRAFPSLDDIPVTVYKLYDYVYAPADNPTMQMSFYIDTEKTRVFSYGMNGSRYDPETGYIGKATSAIDRFKAEEAYVILMGDDIDSYTLQGYEDLGCDKGDELNALTCSVERYETTLRDAIVTFLTDFAEEGYMIADDIETSANLVAEMISSLGVLEDTSDNVLSGNFEDIFSLTGNSQRVMYAEFEVTVPAGDSVTVTAAMTKDASMDFVGKNKDRHGYAVAASLGSCLDFGSQTASISNTAEIEIVNQNFGFDLEAGITSVSLSEQVDHYYIDVKQIDDE